MIVYNSITSYFCAPIKRNINVGTLVAMYENVQRVVIVFSPGTEAIEYEDKQTTDLFDGLVVNSDYFAFVSQTQEDSFGNVIGNSALAWINGLPQANMRQMSNGQIQFWDFGLSAWVIPVLVNGVMEYQVAP